jgi:hypothetical protein
MTCEHCPKIASARPNRQAHVGAIMAALRGLPSQSGSP